MSTNHTPGPWVIEHDWVSDDLPGHVPISARGTKEHLALAQVVWVMEDDKRNGRSSPGCEANARLIAAAPDLLGALQELQEAIRSRGLISTVKALAKAGDAIAKATEESK